MKLLLTFVVVLLILIETKSVLSQNPSCATYDFNDPSILSEFEDCSAIPGMSSSRPLIIESYSDSLFEPFREESQYYLTTNKSVNTDITQCLSSKSLYRGNFSSISFQIGIHLRNINQNDIYNNVQLFVTNVLAFQINPGTDGWKIYERNFSNNDLGFDDSSVSK